MELEDQVHSNYDLTATLDRPADDCFRDTLTSSCFVYNVIGYIWKSCEKKTYVTAKIYLVILVLLHRSIGTLQNMRNLPSIGKRWIIPRRNGMFIYTAFLSWSFSINHVMENEFMICNSAFGNIKVIIRMHVTMNGEYTFAKLSCGFDGKFSLFILFCKHIDIKSRIIYS